MSKKNISKIELRVELDENKIPEKIYWTAKDGNIANKEIIGIARGPLFLSLGHTSTDKHHI